MKRTAIVTGGTANDVPAMACLVMNIKDTNPELADEIVIFHDGISIKDQNLIRSIFPTRFIFYHSPFTEVNDFDDVVVKYFSPMIFCKYECLNLLNEYEYVIWTDYDVVILDNLDELTEKTPTDIKIITTKSPNIAESFFEEGRELTPLIKKYDFSKPGVCMSLFVLTDTLYQHNMLYDWCIEKTKEYSKYLFLPEQAIVNLLLQEFKISITRLLPRIYSVHPERDSNNDNVKIFHVYGQPKFWNGIYNETWEENYKKWIKLGGTPYEYRTVSYHFRKYFQKIFYIIVSTIRPVYHLAKKSLVMILSLIHKKHS